MNQLSKVKKVFAALVIGLLLAFLYINVNYLRKGFEQGFEGAVHPTDPTITGKEACVLPILDPWSDEVKVFVQKPESLKSECLKTKPLLFESNLTHLIPVATDNPFEKQGITSCCYRRILRSHDYHFIFGDKCYNLSIKAATEVPVIPENVFLAIHCKTGETQDGSIVDMHVFPLASAKGWKADATENKTNSGTSRDKLNVVVLGFDSTSRMNFHRTMPQLRKFFEEELDVVEMSGFNRVGPFTYNNYPNLLTGHHGHELEKICIPASSRTVDSCPFIWKDFGASGYYTSLMEDCISTFQREMSGFVNPPTNLYLRAFTLAFERHIGSNRPFVYQLCAGPRPWVEVVLNTIDKVRQATEMEGLSLFSHTFISTLTHDIPGYLFHADEPLLAMLRKWHEQNYLNKTVFIIFSDHGMEFGDFRNTVQGGQEANLPILLYTLPPWIKHRYPMAYKNFVENGKRLTTVFDVYETFHSLMDLRKLEDAVVSKVYARSTNSSRGSSLFHRIPSTRTCAQVEIYPYHCSCARKMEPISIDHPVIKEAAQLLVGKINEIFTSQGMTSGCAQLSLKRIISAHKRFQRDVVGGKHDGYVIKIETTPGSAVTESEVILNEETEELTIKDREFARITPYGNQTRCYVTNRYVGEFCFCK